MRFLPRIAVPTVLALAVTVALAACGGGGGGSSSTPTVAATPTPTPVATSSPAISAALSASFANATAVFSCGCTAQAGTGTADGSGNLTIMSTSVATPASPTPTYTIAPGRNYVVIATNASNAQVWTTIFAGATASRNQNLGGSLTADQYSTLASLYVYYESPAAPANDDVFPTFDDWNFNAISAWVTSMRGGTVSAADQQALTDIQTAQSAGTLLYPAAPRWATEPVNSTIASDLAAIKTANDSAVPTPCPETGGAPVCAGAPTP